jgi:hypothetical protein
MRNTAAWDTIANARSAGSWRVVRAVAACRILTRSLLDSLVALRFFLGMNSSLNSLLVLGTFYNWTANRQKRFR